MIKTKLIQIGNSRGVRLPERLIVEAGLGEEVELWVQKDEIVIRTINGSRAGWAAAAQAMRQAADDLPLDPLCPTDFDQEWEW